MKRWKALHSTHQWFWYNNREIWSSHKEKSHWYNERESCSTQIILSTLYIWINHVYDDYQAIDYNCNSLFQNRMCNPLTEHSPEKNKRNNIRRISTLVVSREKKCKTENSYSPIVFWNSSSSESKRNKPYGDIGNGRNIDPTECEFHTGSKYWMTLTSKMKWVLETSKNHKHENECYAHHLISPRNEPESSEKYRETIENILFLCNFYFFYCNHHTENNPHKIDNRPNGKSETIRC